MVGLLRDTDLEYTLLSDIVLGEPEYTHEQNMCYALNISGRIFLLMVIWIVHRRGAEYVGRSGRLFYVPLKFTAM